MRLVTLAKHSLLYFWQTNLAIALGVAAATAVLVGALLVGDSMRGSLRKITLDRLGNVDDVILSPHFFHQDLAAEYLQSLSASAVYDLAVPVITLESVSIETASSRQAARATDVKLFGLPQNAWELNEFRPRQPTANQIVINQQLADELHIKTSEIGGQSPPKITLRIGIRQALSSDSALGKKTGLVESVTDIDVVDVIPNHDLGRFSLHVSQLAPKSAFVSLDWLQQLIGPEWFKNKSDFHQANAIFLRRNNRDSTPPEDEILRLADRIHPTLEDLGVRVTAVRIGQNANSEAGSTPPPIAEYFSVTSDSLVFDDEGERAVRHALPNAEPVFTYLTNKISVVGGEPNGSSIPFSMIAGIDWPADQTPAANDGDRPIKQPGPNEIVLNSWAATDLNAKVGDTIKLTYFEAESAHGTQVERDVELRLSDVARLTAPAKPFQTRRNKVIPAEFEQPPTLANDPDLTPFVPGLTDVATIENWDLPFETPGIRPADEDYWNNYRTTPKGFVSLATAQKLWGSRFGKVTSFRVPTGGQSLQSFHEHLQTSLQERASAFGFQWLPLRTNGLKSASGSTPFDLLFLGLSFFVIVSALILIALLFRLALEQRASQIGLLSAVGFRFGRTFNSWLMEMAVVCLIGAAVGTGLGVGYAAIMVWGLRSWWVGAVQVPFIELFLSGRSLLIGIAVGFLVAASTIGWTLIRSRKSEVVDLLHGNLDVGKKLTRKTTRWDLWIAAVLGLSAVVLLALAPTQVGDAQAGMFVGGGFLVLVSLLLWVRHHLRRPSGSFTAARMNLTRLGRLNARRYPLRSVLTIGLVAIAVFLIVAFSAFRVSPGDFGTAGFDYVATSSQPIFADLNDDAGRREVLRDPKSFPSNATILSFRYKTGDNASCTNPFQTSQPRVIGVPQAVVDYFDDPHHTQFRWAGFDQRRLGKSSNAWHLLDRRTPNASPPDAAAPIDAVLDKNTAYYSLQIYSLGATFDVTYENGRQVTFRVVGLLDNSILQGSVLIAEADFVRIFPEQPGYRYFLVKAPPGQAQSVLSQLENDLGDQGFDGQSAIGLLSQLLAVQNTYLSAFQSLGALGLLLGTFGLAAVELRAVWERRRELGLLKAVGFDDRRLMQWVFAENLYLLLMGLAIGIAAALVAVIPHVLFGSASIPVMSLFVILLLVLGVGWLTVYWASRSVLRAQSSPPCAANRTRSVRRRTFPGGAFILTHIFVVPRQLQSTIYKSRLQARNRVITLATAREAMTPFFLA